MGVCCSKQNDDAASHKLKADSGSTERAKLDACYLKQEHPVDHKLENQKGAATVPASPRASEYTAASVEQPVLSSTNRIFGFRLCPFTTRVRLAIQVKAVHFETTWNSKDWFNLDWLGTQCPDEGVLTLQHEQKVVTGSADDIIQHIDDTFKEPPLIPSGDIEEAVREWTRYVRDKFSPLVLELLYERGASSHQDLVSKADAVFGRLDHAIWEYSNGGPYFFGSQFTMTDVYLIPFLELVQLVTYFRGIEISPAHSRLLSYSKRMKCFSEYVPVMLDIGMLRSSIARRLPGGEAPPLVTITTLQHRIILTHLGKLHQLAEALWKETLAVDKQMGMTQMKQLSNEYGQLVEVMQEHAQMEERVLFPALETANSGTTHRVVGDYARDLPIMNGIREDIKSIAALETRSPVRDEALLALAARLQTLRESTTCHFEEEESRILPALEQAGVGRKHQEVLVTRCIAVMESSHSNLLPYALSGLSPDEIYQYMAVAQRCLGESKPVLLRRMIQLLKAADDELQGVWKVIQDKLPALATRWDTAAGS